MNRRRTDTLGVGESTIDIGEQTVGETIRRRNDRLPLCFLHCVGEGRGD